MDITKRLGLQWFLHIQSILLILVSKCICLRTQLCEKNNAQGYLPDEIECPGLHTPFLTHIHVQWGVPGRAWYTIPPEVSVRTSNIPNGGLGVFSQTFIKAHSWLAEYEGLIRVNDSEISPYAWSGTVNGEETHLVDAGNIATSNWPRWINCALIPKEQNIRAIWCYGRVYYVTSRPIYPSEELLTYYGHDYAHDLGIDVSLFGGDLEDYLDDDDHDGDGDSDDDEDSDDDDESDNMIGNDEDDKCADGDCDEETDKNDETINTNVNEKTNETNEKNINKEEDS